MEEQKNTDNSLISLLKEFIKEFKALISEHVTLLKQDVSENTNKLIKAAISLAIAFVMCYAGLIFLGLLLVLLLSTLIPAWTALLLVTSVYFGIPLILLVYSLNLLHSVFKKPKKSIEELEKTGEEAKKWMENLKK